MALNVNFRIPNFQLQKLHNPSSIFKAIHCWNWFLIVVLLGSANGYAQEASLNNGLTDYTLNQKGIFLKDETNTIAQDIYEAGPRLEKDTAKEDLNKKARKAALKSAIVPGLGQIQNEQIWKVPIVYVGLGICAYAINFNHQNYKEFQKAYRLRTDGDTTTRDKFHPETGGAVIASDDVLRRSREFYRRNRTLSYIATGILYVANILDAYVFAHLKEFDISDDLSMRVNPPNFANIANRNHVTMGISLKLKP